MSRRDAASAGVIKGHERVSDGLETWIFFRGNDALHRKENEK